MANIRAFTDQLAGHNPVVRMEVSEATADQMSRQACPSPVSANPVAELMRIPIVRDSSLPPGASRTVHADGQRRETHVCAWELIRPAPWDWRRLRRRVSRYRCSLRWSDGTRCDSTTIDPAMVRRAEWLVGPSATGGGS